MLWVASWMEAAEAALNLATSWARVSMIAAFRYWLKTFISKRDIACLPPLGAECKFLSVYEPERNDWRCIDSGEVFSAQINEAIDAAIAAQGQQQ
ncbi:hypothetical protein GCM10010975_13390 [Comamonas phosphati]|nr:hypothetical protein GCM10010975_13390 [Comamonas phosphati]